MATTDGLRYVDSDGHILEHPTAMPEYAPAEYRDRIWHIETDADGEEWLLYNGNRTPANGMSAAGVAGASDEDRARAFRGEMRYTETRPAAWNAKARLAGHGPGRHRPRGAVPDDAPGPAERARRRVRRCPGPRLQRLVLGPRLGGRGPAVRCGRGAARCTTPDDVGARRRRDPPGGRRCPAWCRCSCGRTRRSTGGRSTTRSTTRSGRRRPTPACPIAFHPFLAADLPGACKGLRLAAPACSPTAGTSTTSTADQPGPTRLRTSSSPRGSRTRST